MTVTPADRPTSSGADLQYRQTLEQGIFQIQRCTACGQAVFYPRMLCPHCGASALRWETPSGRGTVYSTTVVRRKAEAGGDYNVALIDLEEGVRMMSRVEDLAPEAVHIGMAVRAEVRRYQDHPLVVFVAREAA